MQTLKLASIGTSTGVVLPEEMIAHLKVEKGDHLYAVETSDGYLLTRRDPAIEEQLAVGREFMKEFRETFEILAK